jgi:hypothetical protein
MAEEKGSHIVHIVKIYICLQSALTFKGTDWIIILRLRCGGGVRAQILGVDWGLGGPAPPMGVQRAVR